MTTEQQREMLECAAKACGLSEVERTPYGFFRCVGVHEDGKRCLVEWNPLANALDTAEMCAKVGIGTAWWLADEVVDCRRHHVRHKEHFKDHDNSRLKAWMFAATMCAAKTQGYEE